jgi:hypothetical protein
MGVLVLVFKELRMTQEFEVLIELINKLEELENFFLWLHINYT